MNTPRTDAAINGANEVRLADYYFISLSNTSRQLETELSAKTAKLDRVMKLLREPSDEQLNSAGEKVGTMDGYEGDSPDADHFTWFKAMAAQLIKEAE